MPRLATRGVTASTRTRGLVTPRTRQRPGTPGKTGTSSEPTHEQIASRAYQIYLVRGRGSGDALSDWLMAERELRGRA